MTEEHEDSKLIILVSEFEGSKSNSSEVNNTQSFSSLSNTRFKMQNDLIFQGTSYFKGYFVFNLVPSSTTENTKTQTDSTFETEDRDFLLLSLRQNSDVLGYQEFQIQNILLRSNR